MVVIDIKNGRSHYYLELHRRISFIRGDSGTGKTALCNIISRDFTIVDKQLVGISDVKYLTYAGLNSIDTCKDCVLFFDDYNVASSVAFSAKAKRFAVKNNLYFVFISRLDASGEDYGGGLSYSINCVYDLYSENGYYTLIPHYRYPNWVNMDFDVAISEDRGGNYKYLKSILKIPVRNAVDGKSTLVDDIEGLLLQGFKSVLVFVDSCAYGCHMEEFNSILQRYTACNVSIMSLYESFEELLCQSNLLSHFTDELGDLDSFANQYLSWETYFEVLIDKLSNGKSYHHYHGKMRVSECYCKSCDLCHPNRQSNCGNVLPGANKLESLFKGTKYEFLLKIMK